MKFRVYLAGPYSSDPGGNTRRAIEAAEWLVHNSSLVPFVPHLSHMWEQHYRHDYEFWMEYDLHFLSACHCLIRMPGHSPGADREVAAARDMGMPILLADQPLPSHAGDIAALTDRAMQFMEAQQARAPGKCEIDCAGLRVWQS